MPEFKLGMNAALYYTTAAADLAAAQALDPGSMTELTNVRDVTLNVETGEADITTRANLGWRATAATLKECSLEFEMVFKPTDAGFLAIRNAWLNSTEIALACLSDEDGEAGAEGPVGNFTITNLSRSEPLEEAIMVSVTAKLSIFGSWWIQS